MIQFDDTKQTNKRVRKVVKKVMTFGYQNHRNFFIKVFIIIRMTI